MTRTICRVCNGLGTIKNPQFPPRFGDPVVFRDTSPKIRIPCQNCKGTGWVGKPD